MPEPLGLGVSRMGPNVWVFLAPSRGSSPCLPAGVRSPKKDHDEAAAGRCAWLVLERDDLARRRPDSRRAYGAVDYIIMTAYRIPHRSTEDDASGEPAFVDGRATVARSKAPKYHPSFPHLHHHTAMAETCGPTIRYEDWKRASGRSRRDGKIMQAGLHGKRKCAFPSGKFSEYPPTIPGWRRAGWG